MNFLVFDAKGVVVRTGYCQNELLQAQAGPGEFSIGGAGMDTTHYVDIYDYYAIKPKTESPATIDQLTITANPIDTRTISNIPNPSTVTLEEFTDTVTDGEYQFTIDLPGTYTVTISSVPYLDKTFIITAT